jgi:hypothetical protein
MQDAIDHMNDDHADTLLDIARYHGKGPFASTGAHLLAMSREEMTIAFTTLPTAVMADAEVIVPFTPALQKESELRPRLVTMAKEASQARIPPFEFPPAITALPLVVLLGALGIVTHLDASIYSHWPSPVPIFLDAASTIVLTLCNSVQTGRVVFYVAVVLHMLEGAWAFISLKQLVKHGGRGWDRVVAWTVMTTLCGFPSAVLLSDKLAKRAVILRATKSF